MCQKIVRHMLQQTNCSR